MDEDKSVVFWVVAVSIALAYMDVSIRAIITLSDFVMVPDKGGYTPFLTMASYGNPTRFGRRYVCVSSSHVPSYGLGYVVPPGRRLAVGVAMTKMSRKAAGWRLGGEGCSGGGGGVGPSLA